MSAATARKPRATAKPPKSKLSAVPSAPGSIVIPAKCKPSQAVSTDRSRPILTHAFLRRRKDGLWITASDSYIAAAVKVEGDAQEGYIPVGALRLMERGQKAEQIDAHAWKVWTSDGVVTFDCSEIVKGSVNFPDLEKMGMWDKEKASASDLDPQDGRFVVGLNPTLAKRLASALGAEACRFEFEAPLRPIRVLPTQSYKDERVGLLMPIRVIV